MSGKAAMFTLDTASLMASSASSSSYLHENTIRVKGVTNNLRVARANEKYRWMMGERIVD